MKEWRYFYYWIAKKSDIEQELSNLGKEGWELICTFSEEVEGEQGYRFFLKRESAFQ
ncbi:hypothetical protein [Paenibacillus sp. GP183]|uniref:hypothetical protein n=1 Tax=Paenibacillus sp. GP183 TaxID=1882751 RepID=UPI00089B082C|nr:hypothetical protein [Paenibacillus sp. GP183]SEC09865.1 hypothetical protein SAMN05443246_2962 [Paenibacillus sp. GP183]